MAKPDHYATMGVAHDAGADDLKKAYRKLSMLYHPDRNPGDRQAEVKFQEISEAYAILRDGPKRAAHDRDRRAAAEHDGATDFSFSRAWCGGAPGGHAASINDMFQRWLASHCHAGAVGLWRAATGTKPGECAFRAIAGDPCVLNSLRNDEAERLALDAEAYIRKLSTAIDGVRPADSPASAALHMVSEAVLAWRRRQASARGPGDGLPHAPGGPESKGADADSWKEALRAYPQFSEAAGAMTLAAAVSLGPQGLAIMHDPWDRVTTLGASRHAARAFRGDLKMPPPSLAHMRTAVSGIQNYAAITGRSPWDVGSAWWSGGSLRGTPASRALRLARDAAACGDIAAGMPGGRDAPGFRIWSEAEERHAFAAMALDRTLMREMLYDDALRFASAAVRHADSLAKSPGGHAAIEAAGLPADSLKAVAFAARSILPDGPQPRPWETAAMAARQKTDRT
jgi:curved DNA-binding protein CbpA